MEKEENVYVETTGAEKVAVCQGDGNDESVREDGSAVPEKFKDVDALARAYGSLQAEFTRRSQRLKELEKRLENLEGDSAGRSGAEKLRKNAKARKAEKAQFESFIAEMERVNAQEPQSLEEPTESIECEQPSNETSEGGILKNGATVYEMNSSTEQPAQGGENVMRQAKEVVADVGGNTEKQAFKGEVLQASVAGQEPQKNSSETLYAQVCRDEGVRLKIIGEYLSSLGKSSVPLMTGGMGTFASPPRKAANITEAGDMALLYLKKPSNR